MNKMMIGALALSLLTATAASAQPSRDDHSMEGDMRSGEQHAGWGQDQGGNHQWRNGERMGYNDWNSAQPIDYRQHNLRRPPRGYEWRQSNGQYILGAVATGLIASAIINSGR
jgi:Ni/Co efflux regulator RcnB